MMGLTMDAPLKRKPRKGQGPMDYTVDCHEPSQFGEGRTLKGEEFKRRKKVLEDEYRKRREKGHG
jgi:hypothetical protein